MPRIAYVNGRYVSAAQPAIFIEDRGFQFADGVYEVCAVMNGHILDWAPHLARLHYSLDALQIASPMGDRPLRIVAERLIRENRLREAILYIQITRGVARRDHGFPANAVPTLVMMAHRFNFARRVTEQEKGVSAISVPDIRWARRDIKSVSLLPNVLAKQEARTAGAFEAIMVDDGGMITEGGSTNIWMVDQSGRIVTRSLSPAILAGITRAAVLHLAGQKGEKVEERAFSLKEAQDAAELFLTSTTAPCLSIVSLNGQPVGKGRPGPVARRLGHLLWAEVERQTGYRPPALSH